jgi:ethanolamine utilization protein EutP (predicted NTPase)
VRLSRGKERARGGVRTEGLKQNDLLARELRRRYAATEDEDKPLKYPTIFNSADIAVITKSDLARAVEFDREAAYANIRSVGPALEIVETSARAADGLDAWLSTLIQQMPNPQPPATSI